MPHDPGTGILAKTGVVVRWELWVPMPSITSAGCLVRCDDCAQLSTAIPLRPDPAEGRLKPDADDTCMLMLELADGTPWVCISTCTFQGRGHWLEVYGDRGTLVLGSDNQKITSMVFPLGGTGGSTPG